MTARTAATLFLLTVLLAPLRAEPLAAGHYEFTARLAPLALDGRYTCSIGTDDDIELDLSTAPNGIVTGKLGMWEQKAPMVGSIRAGPAFVKLALTGVDAQRRSVRINARLKGAAFVGTARVGRKSVPFSLDVSPGTALDVKYVVDLVVDERGRLFGFGTATGANHNVPVLLSGTTSARNTTLILKGYRFFWRGKGVADATGLTATWSAQGFGALIKGAGLRVGD